LSGETVGLHVRRGDYLSFADHHPFVGLDYYRQALALFPDAERIFIVSNDIPWCKEIFTGEKFVFSESPQERPQGNQSALFDLFLLARCKHQIICNSSFSWWASYLNRNPAKRIVAPSRWFGPAKDQEGISARDIYCDRWTVLAN
jgi:Glycosyl transferase family 11